jgi:PAS domain S-box-containing protein
LKTEFASQLYIYVTDIKGIIECSSDRSAVNIDVSSQVHVKAALAGADLFIGGQVPSQETHKNALPISSAYHDRETGDVAGAVTVLLNVAWLEDKLAVESLPPSSTLTMADRDGLIIAQVPGGFDAVGTRLPDRLMEMIRGGSVGIQKIVEADGVERLVAYSTLNARREGLFLSLSIDESAALLDIRKNRNRALMLLFGVAATTVVGVIWMGKRYISEPAARLADTAARLRAGDRTARARVSTEACEFAALADDFNAMAAALDMRERALRVSERQHRAVFEMAVDAMVVIDEKGIIQTINPAATEVFGYSRSEIVGKNVSMLMGADHRIRHDGYIGNYLWTAVPGIIGTGREVEGRRKNGSMFPLELSIAEWRGHEGQRFFTGIMRNISARRGAEEDVEEERTRLRRIIEGAPFPAIVHADDGEVLHISRTWLEITGYTRQELATMDDWVARAYGNGDPKVAVRTDIEKLYSLDRPMDEGEYVIRTAEGKKRIWAFRSAPVGEQRSGRRLVVSMAVDVTERRDGEERIKLLMREVDHRAKNALMVVQSIVQLSRSEDPAKFSEAVEGRIQAMARAHSLLADARWSGADLQRLLADELAAYADTRVDLAGPPISLRPEATQAVSLALHELATNALKHGALSAEDGRLSISWSYAELEGPLAIRWQESGGPRIDGEPLRHGFGSILLRQVVESQLGGALSLEWLVDGLFCQLSIPGDTWQASGVTDTVSANILKAPVVLPPHSGRRVLVVEDEALTAMALQQLLEDAGYIVLGPVGRVEDALDLLRSSPPDAAVLDVNLFGATVDPVAKMLEDMGVPFLFCTGYHGGATAGSRHPAAPVLGKPVNANILLNAVSGLMDN